MILVKQNTPVTGPWVTSMETLLYISKVKPTLNIAHKALVTGGSYLTCSFRFISQSSPCTRILQVTSNVLGV